MLATGGPRAGLLRLQRTAGNKAVSDLVGEARSPVLDVIQQPGRPLEAAARREMETNLGHDFSSVRVHDDPEAARSARSVGATAYTLGEHVVLGDGVRLTGSQGRRLLAHELTHVVQQRRGPVAGTPAPGGIQISDPSDQFERTADRVGREVAHGHNVAGLVGAPAAATGDQARGTSIQRMTPEEAARTAKEDGAPASDIADKTAAGERWDFVAGTWVKPPDESWWDEWYALQKRIPKAQFRKPFTGWQPKPKKQIPTTPVYNPEAQADLVALWGPNAEFDFEERLLAVKARIAERGYTVKVEKTGERSAAAIKPRFLELDPKNQVNEIEVHPGGGSAHKGRYFGLKTTRGIIKVINLAITPTYENKNESPRILLDMNWPTSEPAPRPRLLVTGQGVLKHDPVSGAPVGTGGASTQSSTNQSPSSSPSQTTGGQPAPTSSLVTQ
jgi:hypothetical protein